MIFLLQKKTVDIKNVYAEDGDIFDVGYTTCAQTNFGTAGCEKYLRTSEMVCSSHPDADKMKGCEWYFNIPIKERVSKYSSWKYVDTDGLVEFWKERIGCVWISSGWYLGKQTLFTLCNFVVSNFHPGGVLKWLNLAKLPKIISIEHDYINREKERIEKVKKANENIKKELYPDLKIQSVSFVSKLNPAPFIEWWTDKEIVSRGGSLTFSWEAKNATHCELNGRRYPTKDAYTYNNVLDEFKINLVCFGGGTYRTVTLKVPVGIRFVSNVVYGRKTTARESGPGEKIRNKMKITIENNGAVEANAVELRYVPTGNFYPLAIEGVYLSPKDVAPKYIERKEIIDGREHTIISEAKISPTVFEGLSYMKNIDNENVKRYCLEDFVHWDVTEIAKRKNFCTTANIKAVTTLMGKNIGMGGVEWEGNLPNYYNDSNGTMGFPRFNNSWQRWTVEYFDKFVKNKKLSGVVGSPYAPFSNEIEDGLGKSEKIEVPQIKFSKDGVGDWNTSINFIIDSLEPSSKRDFEFFVELPWCDWKVGYRCDPNFMQYGYWMVVSHAYKNYDSNTLDNFYFKNRVDYVQDMVDGGDIDSWVKRDASREKFPWTILDYVYDSGIVIFANMPLRY